MAACALVAASDFNAADFIRRDACGAFNEVYAVDAGFAHLAAIDRAPDLAIGDFDSLGYVPRARRVVRHPAKKDKSDLELALERACARHADEVWVYGALGGRLDHTVANLQILARFAEGGMDVTAIGAATAMRVLVGPDAFDIPTSGPGTVSVFAATDVARGVIERGMEYSFNDELITNRTSRGLSNELQGRAAAVAVEEGTLYVFYPLPETERL